MTLGDLGDERGQAIIGDRQTGLFKSVLSVPVAERMEKEADETPKRGLVGMAGLEVSLIHKRSVWLSPCVTVISNHQMALNATAPLGWLAAS